MGTTRVRDPQGREWIVRRLWFNISDRSHGRAGLWFDAAPDWWGVGLYSIVVWVIVIVVTAIAWVAAAVLAAVAAVLAAVAAVVTAASVWCWRELARRPWTVEARAGTLHSRRWRVVGWRRSGDILRHVAASISDGRIADLPENLSSDS